MLQCGDGFGLLHKAAMEVGTGREMGGENLDGYGALESGVARAIDLAHATRAEQGFDFVRTELGAARESHRQRRLYLWRFRGGWGAAVLGLVGMVPRVALDFVAEHDGFGDFLHSAAFLAALALESEVGLLLGEAEITLQDAFSALD